MLEMYLFGLKPKGFFACVSTLVNYTLVRLGEGAFDSIKYAKRLS